jgi:hypothetical protein
LAAKTGDEGERQALLPYRRGMGEFGGIPGAEKTPTLVTASHGLFFAALEANRGDTIPVCTNRQLTAL